MIKLPKVVGLTLCERMDVDIQTGKVSLVGLFQVLHFPVFPTAIHPFTVYCILSDGAGEGTIELSIMHLESEVEIYRWQRWIKFPEGLRILNQEFILRKCSFPTPGRYQFDVLFDRQALAHRFLDVYLD
jgi:hypothetical protein